MDAIGQKGSGSDQRSIAEVTAYRLKQFIGQTLNQRNYKALMGKALANVNVMNQFIGQPVRQPDKLKPMMTA